MIGYGAWLEARHKIAPLSLWYMTLLSNGSITFNSCHPKATGYVRVKLERSTRDNGHGEFLARNIPGTNPR